jgi:hypothetical protein
METNLKFRVWSETQKQFIPDYSINSDGTISTKKKVTDKLVVQRFSGLKNRAGIEIYEGDVLIPPRCGRKERQTVKFSSGAFWLGMDMLSRFLSWQIVGNELENPGLKQK